MKINKLFLNILAIPAIFGMDPEDNRQKHKNEELSEWGDLIEEFYPDCSQSKRQKISIPDKLFAKPASFSGKFNDLLDEIKEEVVKQHIISLIKEYISLTFVSDRLQIFFRQVSDLARTSKLIHFFVLKYMQGIDTASTEPKLRAAKLDIDCLESWQYNLFKGAAYKNWSGFWNLILDNVDVINITKEELQEALLCFAVNKNHDLTTKILKILEQNFGVSVKDAKEKAVLVLESNLVPKNANEFYNLKIELNVFEVNKNGLKAELEKKFPEINLHIDPSNIHYRSLKNKMNLFYIDSLHNAMDKFEFLKCKFLLVNRDNQELEFPRIWDDFPILRSAMVSNGP